MKQIISSLLQLWLSLHSPLRRRHLYKRLSSLPNIYVLPTVYIRKGNKYMYKYKTITETTNNVIYEFYYLSS